MNRSSESRNEDRFNFLVSLWCSCDISPEETSELDALIRADQTLLRKFSEATKTHAMLSRLHAVDPQSDKRGQSESGTKSGSSTGNPLSGLTENSGAEDVPPAPIVLGGDQNQPTLPWLTISALGIGSALALSFLFWIGNRNRPISPNVKQQASQSKIDLRSIEQDQLLQTSVARITNGENLRWSKSRQWQVGSWLRPQAMQLESGDAEITLDSGTVIYVAEGSKFEIINSNEIRLTFGSLEADVPSQAIGFKVQTPSGEITDLSTNFGVTVSGTGSSDIHVVKGLVEAKPVSDPKRRPVSILESSAYRLSMKSPPLPVEFSHTKKFEFKSRGNQRKFSFLHMSFDDIDPELGVVKNHGNGEDGHIVEPHESASGWAHVEGRFDRSLYLSGVGTRIKTPIKGINGNAPRTIMFWTRIIPGTSKKNSYSFVAWGSPKDKENGQKWQVGWNPNAVEVSGEEGAIRTEFGGGYVIGSTDLRDGQWHHVASVFVGGDDDGGVADQVRHYIDGKLESVSGAKSIEIDTNSNQESLVLGQYIHDESTFFDDGFKGWIDELYVLDVALTPSQIVETMNVNRLPPATEIVQFTTSNE